MRFDPFSVSFSQSRHTHCRCVQVIILAVVSSLDLVHLLSTISFSRCVDAQRSGMTIWNHGATSIVISFLCLALDLVFYEWRNGNSKRDSIVGQRELSVLCWFPSFKSTGYTGRACHNKNNIGLGQCGIMKLPRRYLWLQECVKLNLYNIGILRRLYLKGYKIPMWRRWRIWRAYWRRMFAGIHNCCPTSLTRNLWRKSRS